MAEAIALYVLCKGVAQSGGNPPTGRDWAGAADAALAAWIVCKLVGLVLAAI